MKYPWIDEYLMNKPGVTQDLQPEWNWIRYQIGGKMFAAILLDWENKPYYINLKLEPLEGELMRQQYTGVIPGYYSNKQHWNSILPDGDVPEDMLRHMLDRSYQLVLNGFSRAKQREILGISCCGTKCRECDYFGSPCSGCNESCGKVFHMRNGQACPIYACCVNKHHRTTCAGCEKLPCSIWQAERDPSFTDEQFADNIKGRINNLSVITSGIPQQP